jgi:hypothetical protein
MMRWKIVLADMAEEGFLAKDAKSTKVQSVRVVDAHDNHLFGGVIDPEIEDESIDQEVGHVATVGIAGREVRREKGVASKLVGAVEKFTLTASRN